MKNNNITYREKYKPYNISYILIIVIFAIIRFVPFTSGSADFDGAVNDLAVGATASAIVAWLIDAASCGKKNKELREKERMVFAEYCGAINDLGFFVARCCKKLSKETDELTLAEYLDKLREEDNYTLLMSPTITIERSYFRIASYVRYVKSTLLLLRQQYGILIESDIVDTDDLRQHLTLQLRLCDEICDKIELLKENRNLVTHDVNELIIKLAENAAIFFPNEINTTYSWHAEG